MKINIDEKIVDAYRVMIIDLLKNPELWIEYSYDLRDNVKSTHKYTKDDMNIYIDIFNDITIKINNTTLYVFSEYKVSRYVRKLKKMLKHKKELKEVQKKEKLMLSYLSDDYKRAIKISHIKDGIK